MTWISVDIEADRPIPGDYSMISLGAVIVEKGLSRTFYGNLKPISGRFDPDSLSISGHSRAETLMFDDPLLVMQQFALWVEAETKGGALFISDNNGFDWQFVNWYFHHFLGKNPFGYNSTNLGSLYKGMEKDFFVSFKRLCQTKHTSPSR